MSSEDQNISIDINQTTTTTAAESISETLPSISMSRIEQSPKLSSTLKSHLNKTNHSKNVSFKRRTRYDKFLNYTHMINRQYMMTMKNLLFHMHRQISKIKRRTNRVEKLVLKQTQTVQPVIRIARLTEDQLSTICINEKILPETLSDNNNNEIEIEKPMKTKRLNKLKTTKNSLNFTTKRRQHIWINNRQQPINPSRYCSICRREFSRLSNFKVHVRNIHKGEYPPNITEQDQSLLEMNEENHEKHDQSLDEKTKLGETVRNQSEQVDGRLRSRSSLKLNPEIETNSKVKCHICNKIYRTDYLKKHQQRAHPQQDISSLSNENNHTNEEDKSVSIDQSDKRNASTPAITIAEMDTDDVPIRFRADTNKTIVLAVTCLESYQLEFVEKFLEKFSSNVCQTNSIDSRTTHLITNDEKQTLRSPLSMKLIEAIAHHCFCVSYRWIIDCLKYDRIIDEDSYEIEGDDTETQPHGGPRRSRLIQNRHALFRDICFMIKCTENSDIKMTNERLEDLITTCGGQIITCVTQRLLNDYRIIVLCDMLYVSERRHNYNQCRQLGIHFVSSDWVLESILEYRQKPFSLFEEVPL